MTSNDGSSSQNLGVFNPTVIVSALGYFVDVYDITIFSIIRLASLSSLGLSGTDLFSTGVSIQNAQLIGMVIGGLIAGVLGDKLGRRSILFVSIILYSLANLANGFVHTIDQYIALRFLAGIGLAGEAGAAVTLVSEVMGAKNRGYGTTLVACTGLMGAVVAALVGKFMTWNVAYITGGLLGLLLLTLRIVTTESQMFRSIRKSHVRRGDITMILLNPKRLNRYLLCLSIGLPVWFASTVLVPYSPELAKALYISGSISVSDVVILSFGGAAVGDVLAGFLSQLFRNRRKTIMAFLIFNAVTVFMYLHLVGMSISFFYFMSFVLGLSAGYFAVFLTVTAELFGTNLRATVATSMPNFVRGLMVPIIFAVRGLQIHLGLRDSMLLAAAAVLVLALCSILVIDETYGKNLAYLEK